MLGEAEARQAADGEREARGPVHAEGPALLEEASGVEVAVEGVQLQLVPGAAHCLARQPRLRTCSSGLCLRPAPMHPPVHGFHSSPDL